MGTLDRADRRRGADRRLRRRRRSDDELSALRARRIGFVFQQFYLLDGLTAVDNVAGGLLYAGVRARSAASARARRSSASASATASTTARTSSRAARSSAPRSPARWSAGPRSSSPTSRPASSTPYRRAIIELLRELNEAGTTIVVITHDPSSPAAFPRQVEMRDGEIVRDDGPVAA